MIPQTHTRTPAQHSKPMCGDEAVLVPLQSYSNGTPMEWHNYSTPTGGVYTPGGVGVGLQRGRPVTGRPAVVADHPLPRGGRR